MKSIRLLAAVIVCMLLVGTAAASTNVIDNPGFETGDISSWTSSLHPDYKLALLSTWTATSVDKQAGSYSAYMTRSHAHSSNAYAYLTQNIDTRHTTTITGYAKSTGTGDVGLEVHIGGGAPVVNWVSSEGWGWTQWSHTLTSGQKAENTELKITAKYMSGGYGTIYVDSMVCNVPDTTADYLSATVIEGIAPLTTTFVYDSSYANFGHLLCGDGDGVYTTANASTYHTYNSAGTYTASWRVFNQKSTSGYLYKTITVLDAISADFSANTTSGPAPLTVQFTDSSTGSPDTWYWTFGDGSNSTLQNPTHTYSSSGTFTVSLNASNSYSYDTETKTDHITASYTPPYTGQAVGGLVKSALDGSVLADVEMTLTNMTTLGTEQAYTNVSGYYLFDDLPTGTYRVGAKKTGYLDIASYSFVLGAGEYKDQPFNMEPFGSTATGGIGSQYPPHIVRFYLVDKYGRSLGSNITVTAIGTQSTVGAWDWLTALFGIPSGAPIDTDAMEGTTGEDGSISFAMVDIVKYTMTFARSPDISYTWALYPKNTEYNVPIPTTTYTPPSRTVFYTVTMTEHNTTHTNITAQLEVSSSGADTYTFSLYDTDKIVLSQTGVSIGGAITSGNTTFQVETDPGVEYYVRASSPIDPGTGERWFDQTRAITIRGRIFDLGIDSTWYQWIALSLMFCIGAIFSGRNTKIGAIVLPLFGGFMWWIGWLSVSVLLVSVAMVLGVIFYMRESEGGR